MTTSLFERRRVGRRRVHAAPLDEVAAITQRLAVLLSAGVAPSSAWSYLVPEVAEDSAVRPLWHDGKSGEGTPVAVDTDRASAGAAGLIEAAVDAAVRGDSVPDALADRARLVGGEVGEAWLGLAAAWEVATVAGAPLAACLRTLAATFRELGQLHRDCQVALSGPRATARLVMGLPVGGILVGAAMGFNAVHMLFFTAPGWLCLCTGGALMWVASRWNRRLVSTATAAATTPGLQLDLMAIAMAGGASVDRSRRLVQETTLRFGIPCSVLADNSRSPEGSTLTRVLRLSERAGVPAAELLRSEAQQIRQDARSAGQQRAEALAVTLMLPLGLCVLPAFMLVGVVPLVLSILAGTLESF
ncbi:type II secretion system F family protein [Cryobacterium sp. CG_9.6]|uniref:type II secretion system F family protein n=1 Tax=Cryobacterium sp. CG_9.6 TaxID=2760710 RepID=UPI002476035D|nr:type II secretion system F family protein [Cryobacterium sp. CG_9.6]MDH6235834.1 tight adherence protein B [Cryobacterium sp. CG_9.6]